MAPVGFHAWHEQLARWGDRQDHSRARTVAGRAHALVTINPPHDVLHRVFDAFGEGGGDGKPISLEVHLSWHPGEATAEVVAHDQWRTNVFGSALAWNLELPTQSDAAAVHVSSAVGEVVRVSSAFIDAFAETALPELQRGAS